MAGPKHSTSVPSSVKFAVPLNVDENEVALVANPVLDLALKALLGPQIEKEFDLCGRGHSLFPFTLQMVKLLMFPVTLHLNVKFSPGQARGAAVNCPATTTGVEYSIYVPFIKKKQISECSFNRNYDVARYGALH